MILRVQTTPATCPQIMRTAKVGIVPSISASVLTLASVTAVKKVAPLIASKKVRYLEVYNKSFSALY
jgi:hypothetical protein